jgi:hypothetical protein
MEAADVRRWFDEYLETFASCGRGERDASSLLAYYDVPLLVTTDDGFFILTSDAQVVAMVHRQIERISAAAYRRTEIVDSGITTLNRSSALYRGTFSRQRGDGGEISRLTATYLVTDGLRGRRISVLAMHGQ